jgi:hypothetical protein
MNRRSNVTVYFLVNVESDQDDIIFADARNVVAAATVDDDDGALADDDEDDDEEDDGEEDDDDDDDDDDVDNEHVHGVAPPEALAGIAQNQEQNHNWIDWDRAADDLTWERLLGLDGSLQFVEHVFWVVTLNTLFILIFAYTPYHLGKIITSSKPFRQSIADTRFTIPITTLTAYGRRPTILIVLL